MSNTHDTSLPTLATGFVHSCRTWPHNKALHVRDTYYTYYQLADMVQTIIGQLGTQPVGMIGIHCEESAWTYAAMLAVSQVGACYVPLSNSLPATRLQTIANECDLQLIISESELPFEFDKTLIIDKHFLGKRWGLTTVDQKLAYILFTSGSTGQSKGVPVSRQNVQAFFDHFKKHYDFNTTDRFLQPYELSFDVSVFATFIPWACGACAYVVPANGFKYLNIVNTIKNYEITVSSMVPSVLSYLERYMPTLALPSLRFCFFSGDKLYHHLATGWQKVASNARVINCYGPTETTVVCTEYMFDPDSRYQSVNDIVPLGKPFEGTRYLLRGPNGDVLTAGTGELCFTGDQVVEAYLHNTHQESFFTHGSERYYRTGDLASVNAHGNLVFHGRTDSQVKINGYRVETVEVEHAIFVQTGKQSTVLAFETGRVNKLIAFLEDTVDIVKLKADLSKTLPAYMLPADYYTVTEFPMNIQGKIDRQELKQRYDERKAVR